MGGTLIFPLKFSIFRLVIRHSGPANKAILLEIVLFELFQMALNGEISRLERENSYRTDGNTYNIATRALSLPLTTWQRHPIYPVLRVLFTWL